MTLDDNLFQADIPQVPKMINQLTSNQAVRAFITIALLAMVLYQVIRGQSISDIVFALLSTMLGYYFGENTPPPDKPKSSGDGAS